MLVGEHPGIEPTAPDPNIQARLESLRHEHRSWSQPEMFDLSQPVDQQRMRELLESGRLREGDVEDPIDQIANDLFEMNHPGQTDDLVARAEYVDHIKMRGAAFGRWFYFGQTGKLVRYAGPEDHQALMTFRNRDLITAEEQNKLSRATILVAGLSVGSHIVTRVACSGIGSTWILADPDVLSYPNLNRFDASPKDVGTSKAHFVAQRLREKNPYARVIAIDAPVNARLLEALGNQGLPKPNIVFDAVDKIEVKVRLRIFARREGIPLAMVTDVGEVSLGDLERHDLDGRVPFFGGRLPEDLVWRIEHGEATEAEIAQATVAIVGREHVSTRLWASVQQKGKTLGGFPQLGDTAAAGGSLATKITRAILLEGMPEHEVFASGRYALSAEGVERLEGPEQKHIRPGQQGQSLEAGYLGTLSVDASLNT